MTTLAEFLDVAPKLEQTASYQRFDELLKYYWGTQYEGRELDACGYNKQMPGVVGSLTCSPAWNRRDPGAVWNLRGEVADALTERSMSGDAWCRLAIADDPDAEDYLKALVEQCTMEDAVSDARTLGGATGTAIASFQIREGEVFVEAHNARDTIALDWADPVRHRPSAVVQRYWSQAPLAADGAKQTLIVRYWDVEREALFQRVEDNVGGWRWEKIDEFIHGLGFCPVYWCPQGFVAPGSHEGTPDGAGTESAIDDANELLAAASATTKRNADDTLVVQEDPALAPRQIRKGGFNTIFARGGASYLSQDGESARICLELAEKRAQHVLRRSRVVVPSVEDLGRATTGEAMKRLMEPMDKACGRLRRTYGRWLIVPMARDILAACRTLEARGEIMALPPKVTINADGNPDVTPRKPGTSEAVVCVWPAPNQPTADDRQKAAASAVAATGGKAVLSKRTAVESLMEAGFPIASVDAELAAIEKDGAEAAKQMAASMGMAAEAGSGEAGPMHDIVEHDDKGANDAA